MKKMHFKNNLDDNLRFMLLEIKKMLGKAQEAVENPQRLASILAEMSVKDDYIDNLKIVIKKKSYGQIYNASTQESILVEKMMAVNVITNNLEKIADHALQLVTQLTHLTDPHYITNYDYRSYFQAINKAIDHIEQAFFHNDSKLAIDICKAEFALDDFYLRDFEQIKRELKKGKNLENLLSTMFVFRYLERIGDSLLNIGEAIISRMMGSKMRINQYISLKDSLETGEEEIGFHVEKVGLDAKSGCQIGIVSSASEKIRECVFKTGNRQKILLERRNLEYWQSLFPGAVPRIYSYNEYGEHASLLMELMQGLDLKQIMLRNEEKLLQRAFHAFSLKLKQIWQTTRAEGPCKPRFVSQLKKRIEDVSTVHASFINAYQIGEMHIPDLYAKLEALAYLDDELTVPFTLLIHGDLNLDNIIYNDLEDSIHFIDLYRSQKGDYVQDITVLIVSLFRLPVFTRSFRKKAKGLIRYFLAMARDFAEEQQDGTFPRRLALGLARSLITSTRFELGKKFSQQMFMRGMYLLDQLSKYRGREGEFNFNAKILEY